MRRLLEARDVLWCIDLGPRRLKKLLESSEGKRDNKLAMILISNNVEEKLFKDLLDGCENAREMWLTLESIQLNLFDSTVLKDHDQDILVQKSVNNEPDDADSEDSSCYKEATYVGDPKLTKEMVNHCKDQLNLLRKEVNANQAILDKIKPKCQFCNSKNHTAPKCFRLKSFHKHPHPPVFGCSIF